MSLAQTTNITLGLVFLAFVAYVWRFVARFKAFSSFIFARQVRYLFLIPTWAAFALVCRSVEGNTHQLRLGVAANIFLALHAYAWLGWSGLNIPPDKDPATKPLARPRAATLAAGVSVIQIVTYVEGRGTNDWLAATTVLAYTVGCLMLFLWEIGQGLRLKTRMVGLRFKYRCLSLGIVGASALAVHGLDFAGHIISTIPSAAAAAQTLWIARNNIEPATAVCVGLFIPFDVGFKRLYDKFVYQRQFQPYIDQLQRLAKFVLQLQQPDYGITVFGFKGAENDWILDHIVTVLTEMRVWAWEMQAHQEAERRGVQVETLPAAEAATIDEDAAVCAAYLCGLLFDVINTEKYINRFSPAKAVPRLPVKGLREEAQYFVQLATAIRDQLPIKIAA